MKKSLKLITLTVLLFATNQLFAQIPPVTDGLIGYWPFNGNTEDLSNNNNDAINYGATLTTDIDNYQNSAYAFEDGDFIQLTNTIGYTQWTISTWVYPTMPIPTELPYEGRYTIIQGDSDTELLGLSNEGLCLYTTTIVPYTFSPNTWYHVVFQYDGTNLTGYINQTTTNSTIIENPLEQQITRRIGIREAGGRDVVHPFQGKIDEIIIYDRVLNDSEIGQLYYDTEQTKPSNNISESDITNWNTAFGWGDHAAAGYITENFLTENNYANHWQSSNNLLSPSSTNVSGLLIERDVDNGFTNFMLKNNNETSNYTGALFIAKGGGADYTNTMYFGKYSDNFYITEWAGNGAVSTDQDLILASVGSDDPTNPNPDPRIIFQTGGKFQSPDFAITRMVLDENGNLGIGTTTPDEKLTVKGKIHTEEVLIDLNIPVPDYVFEADYPLKKIEEVEEYVNKNKHLPEIPSAGEIEKTGLGLGEMNMKLLKKIEELTLYVIELNKEVKSLKAENKELTKKVNELKK